MSDIKNVLITRFSALGDIAMTIPVVYCVCRSNPHIHFFFLTRKLPATLFINAPSNLTVIPFNPKDYDGLSGLRRLAGKLKQEYEIDAYADLHDVLRTKLLRFFLKLKGVKVAKIHKNRRAGKRLTRARNKIMLPLTSSRAKYREVFWRLGLQREDNFISLFDKTGFYKGQFPHLQPTEYLSPDPVLFATATAPKMPGETWIAIAPFAQHPGKIYPLHLMEQVVAKLAVREGYKLFMMGAGPQESSVFAQWRNKYGEQLVNMANLQLGLPAEMALLSHCNVMLSMDSANMHIASLVGLRVVSVWGATHPYCGFMGWHQRREDAVQLDMMCRPCSIYGNKPCRFSDFHCLEGLPPTLILDHIDRLLSSTSVADTND
ncbi:MAG: glycosyltransferase family 9 protein [Muribaculaceae bacterium]|nr:glycosyltransferase family 9 protein [Muribaculaceae bacterium]